MMRRAAAALAALVAASCGAHLELMTLPAGAGTPAPDAAEALTQATAACAPVSTFTAEIAVAGSVGGQHVPHAHLIVGLEAPSSARIEATAPLGGAVFVFVARADDSTLVLPRDNRVLEHGRPAEVLEAVTGVPLDPAELLATLTGCGDKGADVMDAHHLGDQWIVIPDRDEALYLMRERPASPWRLVAATHGGGASGWRSEYHDFRGGLPQSIRLSAVDRSRFDLALSISQADVNMPIEPAAFTVRVPASATPITLRELRDAGALQ